MKQSKIPTVVLLTALLLAVFALLPKMAASVQDHVTINHFGYSQMQQVQLNLSEKKETIPMMGKLSMLSHIEAVDIDYSQTSMTEEEVYAAAEDWMGDYEEAGIFQWFDITFRSAYPKLGIDMTDAKNYLVFWTVTYTNQNSPHQSLMMDIDDETGKILSIRYAVFDSYSMDGVWKRNQLLADAFTEIYFAQLGMTEAKEYAQSTKTGYEYSARDGGVSSALYRLEDAAYGQILLEFYVEGPGGFYTNFP